MSIDFRNLSWWKSLVCLLAFATTLGLSNVATAQDGDEIQVVPPDQTLAGMTYSELAGTWWTWALSSPLGANPVLDTTGEFCDANQSGPIWFLAGSFGGEVTRTCNAPAGKHIFFPIINSVFVPVGETIDESRAAANASINAVSSLTCKIDGEPVEDLFAYRAQSPPGGFALISFPGSLAETLGLPPGAYFDSVADGYWIGLKPLPPGSHTIEFGGTSGDPDNPDFEVMVTYELTVTGGGE